MANSNVRIPEQYYTVTLYDGHGKELDGVLVAAAHADSAIYRAKRFMERTHPEKAQAAFRWDAAVRRD